MLRVRIPASGRARAAAAAAGASAFHISHFPKFDCNTRCSDSTFFPMLPYAWLNAAGGRQQGATGAFQTALAGTSQQRGAGGFWGRGAACCRQRRPRRTGKSAVCWYTCHNGVVLVPGRLQGTVGRPGALGGSPPKCVLTVHGVPRQLPQSGRQEAHRFFLKGQTRKSNLFEAFCIRHAPPTLLSSLVLSRREPATTSSHPGVRFTQHGCRQEL